MRFSGSQNMYKFQSDSVDIYGRSKLLGEINYGNSLTLRTSIIGHEFSNKLSLLEWFLSKKGEKINGFKKALFSGLTTNELSKFILNSLESNIKGLYHISSNPINKYDLLVLIKKIYNLDIEIIASDELI